MTVDRSPTTHPRRLLRSAAVALTLAGALVATTGAQPASASRLEVTSSPLQTWTFQVQQADLTHDAEESPAVADRPVDPPVDPPADPPVDPPLPVSPHPSTNGTTSAEPDIQPEAIEGASIQAKS